MFYLNVADEIGDKIIEILSSNWVTLENETIHTRPPPLQSWGVFFVVFYR